MLGDTIFPEISVNSYASVSAAAQLFSVGRVDSDLSVYWKVCARVELPSKNSKLFPILRRKHLPE